MPTYARWSQSGTARIAAEFGQGKASVVWFVVVKVMGFLMDFVVWNG